MDTFRPNRRVTRLSLSAVPSTSDENSLANKKKRSQSLGGEALSDLLGGIQDLKKKQQQSLVVEDLSPRKRARRSLVPGRSILKARSHQTDDTDNLDYTGTHTFTHNLTSQFGSNTNLTASIFKTEEATGQVQEQQQQAVAVTAEQGQAAGQDDEDEDEEDEEEEDMSMEVTDAVGSMKGRKSLMASASRRVSFAPKAHVRCVPLPLSLSPHLTNNRGSQRL